MAEGPFYVPYFLVYAAVTLFSGCLCAWLDRYRRTSPWVLWLIGTSLGQVAGILLANA